MSIHNIEAEIEVVKGDEAFYPIIDIQYGFHKGSPEVRYQRNGDPGWPAEPPEVELLDASIKDAAGATLTPQEVTVLAEKWLDDSYEKAVENAQEDYE